MTQKEQLWYFINGVISGSYVCDEYEIRNKTCGCRGFVEGVE